MTISTLRGLTGYSDDVSGLEKQWNARKSRDGDDRADEDFAPSIESSDDGNWSETSDDDEQEEEELDTGVDGADSALLLYSDLAKKVNRRHRTPSPAHEEEDNNTTDQTTILLAHLTSDHSSPLTRRRFKSLQSGYRGQQLSQRIASTSQQDGGSRVDDSRRNCVICTENERTIVTYPCRTPVSSSSSALVLTDLCYRLLGALRGLPQFVRNHFSSQLFFANFAQTVSLSRRALPISVLAVAAKVRRNLLPSFRSLTEL